MTYRKSLLKNCTTSFKCHKHTCLQRPHCEYLWELQAKEQQPQLGQLTQPWEWISIKYWAVLRWPSLEVRALLRGQQDSVFHQRKIFHQREVFHTGSLKLCTVARALSHRAEMQSHRVTWPVLWALTSTAQSRPHPAMPVADWTPALHGAPPRQSLSARAASLTAEASVARLYSLPLGTPRSMLFYLTIPFPFPEFLERVWHRSRFSSLKCSLHMEIKALRKAC